MMHILLVGFNSGVLQALHDIEQPPRVTVVEEKDLWNNKNLDAKRKKFGNIDDVVIAEYQKRADVTIDPNSVRGVDAVLPGLEYAVPTAAGIADQLGLPGAGVTAARTLCNKLRLREATERQGMLAPEYRRINSAQELQEFLANGPCVLKPAERQASLGVVKLTPGDDPQTAWTESVHADEGVQLANREFDWSYMVERELPGEEFSTEALVQDGRVVFVNVTYKTIAGGRYPVEMGHAISSLPPSAVWRDRVQQLADAVSFQSGIMHAEWIGDVERAVLVECAGRPPGDKIMDLIGLAWGFDPTEAWMRILAGDTVELPAAPNRSAAISYISSDPGQIELIDGVDEVAAIPGVVSVEMTKSPGDEVAALRSSWERAGHVIGVGTDTTSASETAARAAHGITISTKESA
ncbi:ATP-grasp domain-containing protein [Lipingzhangella sp. LS1_29]|uniref:ATP-grasp domain-containing protein n=1 Tax=Lipingzhangella rawalii TaxID=2055835 RepID=A0ABU2H9T5_9ACTN|nr:ATP-grasp domain-containing protein [Lipingzhangella rawalii]MDS1271605.1 ATP-grasp domain-containing protein [Lipingzhangella rawalii]